MKRQSEVGIAQQLLQREAGEIRDAIAVLGPPRGAVEPARHWRRLRLHRFLVFVALLFDGERHRLRRAIRERARHHQRLKFLKRGLTAERVDVLVDDIVNRWGWRLLTASAWRAAARCCATRAARRGAGAT